MIQRKILINFAKQILQAFDIYNNYEEIEVKGITLGEKVFKNGKNYVLANGRYHVAQDSYYIYQSEKGTDCYCGYLLFSLGDEYLEIEYEC